jgi:hypothetical protein
MRYLRAKTAVRQTAESFGMTEEQYAAEVRLAVEEAMANANPYAQKEWKKMFPNGIDGMQCYEIIDRLARWVTVKRTHRF